jgi:hypothetical protein
MSIPTTPLRCSLSKVGATVTVAVSGPDGSPTAKGRSVTATHPPAQASTPVAESSALVTELPTFVRGTEW